MGAKTWMLVYSNNDIEDSLKKNSRLDRIKTAELLKKLFPHEILDSIEDGTLSHTCPKDDIIYAGYIGNVFVVAAYEFAMNYPSKIDSHFLKLDYGNTIHLHAMHSAVDWFAFGVWKSGKLERALSLSPEFGILEDIGKKLLFEISYWNGEHPALSPEDQDENEDPYPLPYNPLELGEVALQNFFGYVLEGVPNLNSIDPESVPLMGFKRHKKPKWKFW